MRQYIDAVIAVRNIFTPLCLFIQTSTNNLAVAGGNGNGFFTQKLHVQIANKLRSPKCRTKFNYCLRFDQPNFSLPSTFKGTDSRDKIKIFWQTCIIQGLNMFLNFEDKLLSLSLSRPSLLKHWFFDWTIDSNWSITLPLPPLMSYAICQSGACVWRYTVIDTRSKKGIYCSKTRYWSYGNGEWNINFLTKAVQLWILL